LQSGGDIPEGHYEDLSMKRTVVPFRNGILLSIAAGYAESVGAEILAYGAHAGDHAIYPDCRKQFVDAMMVAVRVGTYITLTLQAPFVNMTKREVGLLGKDLGVDFSMTYSCYKGGEFHCGRCGTCTERKEALEGFDPTIYEDLQ
jgi:7-cyano-7-deazaguanine synthase